MLVLGALAALGLLLLALGYFFLRGQQEDSHDLMLYTVQRGPFVHEVSEKGEIESSNSVEVRCQVKARTPGATVSEATGDRALIDAWADALKLRGWYEWVPYDAPG